MILFNVDNVVDPNLMRMSKRMVMAHQQVVAGLQGIDERKTRHLNNELEKHCSIIFWSKWMENTTHSGMHVHVLKKDDHNKKTSH